MEGIFLQGATLDQLKDMFRSVLKEEGWVPKETLRPLTKTEACLALEVSYKTLMSKMKMAGITDLTPENVELLKQNYPKGKRIYPEY